MKYLHEAVIIAAVTFAAEIIKFFIPLPVPASIYGLILLFVLLKSGAVKLEQIEHVGGLLLELMPLLLVPASVELFDGAGHHPGDAAAGADHGIRGDGFGDAGHRGRLTGAGAAEWGG